MRTGEVRRKTRETDMAVRIGLDGKGLYDVKTPVPFMSHMLELFAKHGLFDLTVKAEGDVDVDYHHTIEDLGLTLGEALVKAVGDKSGIRRYGFFTLPMDEALATVALDFSGRPCLVYKLEPCPDKVKDIDSRLFHEFFQALANKAGMNLHIMLHHGGEAHHIFEAIFKAFAKALSIAVSIDPRVDGVPSTKGVL